MNEHFDPAGMVSDLARQMRSPRMVCARKGLSNSFTLEMGWPRLSKSGIRRSLMNSMESTVLRTVHFEIPFKSLSLTSVPTASASLKNPLHW